MLNWDHLLHLKVLKASKVRKDSHEFVVVAPSKMINVFLRDKKSVNFLGVKCMDLPTCHDMTACLVSLTQQLLVEQCKALIWKHGQ